MKEKTYVFRLDGALYRLLQEVRKVKQDEIEYLDIEDPNDPRRLLAISNIKALEHCARIIQGQANE